MHSGLNRAHHNYAPLIALDHGYLIFAGHPIGGAKRFDGKPEAWLIDRREFEAAFSASLGKASLNAESQWQSLVAIVECLEKGDHSKAQAIVDRIESSAPKNSRRIGLRDTVSRALKPIAKNASSHPPLSAQRQKFNPNHDALGRFTFGSQSTAEGAAADEAKDHHQADVQVAQVDNFGDRPGGPGDKSWCLERCADLTEDLPSAIRTDQFNRCLGTCMGTNPSPEWEGIFPPWEPSRRQQSPMQIPGPRKPNNALEYFNPNCLSCH
jgi:hypothetical protein